MNNLKLKLGYFFRVVILIGQSANQKFLKQQKKLFNPTDNVQFFLQNSNFQDEFEMPKPSFRVPFFAGLFQFKFRNKKWGV